jgi:hypothetical protein
MEEKKMRALEKFINERLPEAEKKRVVLVIENKPLTWLQIIEELKKGGSFAKKVETAFEEMIK